MLAYISGSLDQELLLRNEYLVTENRILKNQIKGRLQLTDPERISLGHKISHQTVANILKRHGLLPAPDREKRTTWGEFIRTHTEVLAAVDFFSAEVWTSVGLIT